MEKIAVRAAALYIVVPMDHFMNNAPKEYLEQIAKSPEPWPLWTQPLKSIHKYEKYSGSYNSSR
jgi:hypothetical protein